MLTNKPAPSKYVQVDLSSARLDRLWTSVSTRLAAHSPRSRFRWPAVAMVAALSAVAAWVALPAVSPQLAPSSALHRAVLETASDALALDLADGSRLELAARTRVETLESADDAIALRLERGQLSCDLLHRPGRRFSVFAADVEVRVTGTRFSVALEPGRRQVSVSVQRGSVEVVAPGHQPKRQLGAGEQWSIELPDRSDFRSAATPSAATASAATPAPAAPAVPSAPHALDRAAMPEDRGATRDAPVTASPAAGATEDPDDKTLGAVPSAAALFEQANTARRAGDVAGAARAYESLLAKYPRDARAGLSAFELGRLRFGPLADVNGAVQAFGRAVALAPGAAFRQDAMARLVEALGAAGQRDRCMTAKQAYLKEYPTGVHAALVQRQCGAR